MIPHPDVYEKLVASRQAQIRARNAADSHACS